jgi:hypothetical protein
MRRPVSKDTGLFLFFAISPCFIKLLGRRHALDQHHQALDFPSFPSHRQVISPHSVNLANVH